MGQIALTENISNVDLVGVSFHELEVVGHFSRMTLDALGYPVVFRNMEDLFHSLGEMFTVHTGTNNGDRFPVQLLTQDVVEVLVRIIE